MRSFGLARLSLAACVCGLVTLPARLPAQGAAKTNQYGNPATLKPAPTKAAIDADREARYSKVEYGIA